MSDEKQEGKTMKKANIMKRAWNLYREAGCTTRYEFGLALKAAWQEANSPFGMMTQLDTIKNAFYSKYPNGTFSKQSGTMGYRVNVTFAPGGKTYNYIGGVMMVAQKLGLKIA